MPARPCLKTFCCLLVPQGATAGFVGKEGTVKEREKISCFLKALCLWGDSREQIFPRTLTSLCCFPSLAFSATHEVHVRQASGWASSGSVIALMSLGTLWISLAFVLPSESQMFPEFPSHSVLLLPPAPSTWKAHSYLIFISMCMYPGIRSSNAQCLCLW